MYQVYPAFTIMQMLRMTKLTQHQEQLVQRVLQDLQVQLDHPVYQATGMQQQAQHPIHFKPAEILEL
jgi:hypothetical protein